MDINGQSRIIIQFIDSETGQRSDMVAPKIIDLLHAIKANEQHVQSPDDPPNPLILIMGAMDEGENENITSYPLVHTHSFFATHKHLMEQQ